MEAREMEKMAERSAVTRPYGRGWRSGRLWWRKWETSGEMEWRRIWRSGNNEGVAGGCLTQPPGEEMMGWPPEETLAWTHRRSFTLGVREDRYGQVGRLSGVDGWWRTQVAAVEGGSSPVPPSVFTSRFA